MFRLSQRDERWATKKIGQTLFTIGRWGCTLTAICMIHSKWYKHNHITPDWAAKNFEFNEQGMILWIKTVFPFMKFLKRGYGYDEKEIQQANEKKKGIIVEVDGTHWCAVHSFWPIVGAVLIDPWDGSVLWNWKSRYKKITGYAVFEKSPQ